MERFRNDILNNFETFGFYENLKKVPSYNKLNELERKDNQNWLCKFTETTTIYAEL